MSSFILLFRRIFSFGYFFPLQIDRTDRQELASLKRKANAYLFAFYLTFLGIIIYGLLTDIFR